MKSLENSTMVYKNSLAEQSSVRINIKLLLIFTLNELFQYARTIDCRGRDLLRSKQFSRLSRYGGFSPKKGRNSRPRLEPKPSL